MFAADSGEGASPLTTARVVSQGVQAPLLCGRFVTSECPRDSEDGATWNSTGSSTVSENSRPNTDRATQQRIQEQQRELLEHPPYSLDVASSLISYVPLMKRLKRRCGS
ncbi:uncharacterized protein LOC111861523 [Cryptotermes secundus]|uniref:uncharacterized protein LOC111861523 n=1 Tax=Cryptotermes secundus TaxID=105785 RepID=UPI001454CF73|nr:uncharacterized protein LOC111861523 [Cryptotermes secundus]